MTIFPPYSAIPTPPIKETMLAANPSQVPIITIDGPSGSGKGTIMLQLAHLLDWHTLDSGALYRVVALAAQQQAIALDDELAVAQVALNLDVRFAASPDLTGTLIILQGQEVSLQIRSEIAGKHASQVAALPAVRQALLARQRAFYQAPGLVADGRDMGTVVFPNADLKIFLTANAEERAERRYKQLKEKGIDANLASLIQEIKDRDKRDTERAIAPLVPATDAHIIDTTGLTIESVMTRVLQLVATLQTPQGFTL